MSSSIWRRVFARNKRKKSRIINAMKYRRGFLSIFLNQASVIDFINWVANQVPKLIFVDDWGI